MSRTVTRDQVLLACQALGLDPEEAGQVTIWPDAILVNGRPGTAPELIKVVAE